MPFMLDSNSELLDTRVNNIEHLRELRAFRSAM